MYDMMPIIFGVMMIVLGLYMVKDPVHATKKSLRQDENAVKKVIYLQQLLILFYQFMIFPQY